MPWRWCVIQDCEGLNGTEREPRFIVHRHTFRNGSTRTGRVKRLKVAENHVEDFVRGSDC